MDTLVIQDFTIAPKLHGLAENDRILARVALGNIVLGETGYATRDEDGGIWRTREAFVLPILEQTLSIMFFVLGHTEVKSLWGSIDIEVAPIAQISGGGLRSIRVELTAANGTTPVADIRFGTRLLSSNYMAKKSPDAVIETVLNMDNPTISILLTQIVLSDTSCVNADTALLYVLRKKVASIPDDDADKPRALTMLANIHVLRYDMYLQVSEELAYTEPVYAVYKDGLMNALKFLEEANRVAPNEHPKRSWMITSLCMCLQRFISEPGSPASYISKLAEVVPRLDDKDDKKLPFLKFLRGALEIQYADSNDTHTLEKLIIALDSIIALTDDVTAKADLLVQQNALLETGAERLTSVASLSRRLVVLRRIPDDDPRKPILLNHLGDALFLEGKSSNNDSLIYSASEVYNEALSLIAQLETHPERSSLLTNISVALQELSSAPENDSQIKDALEGAVNHCSTEDPNKITYLANLGIFLLRQIHGASYGTNDPQGLDRVRSLIVDALELSRDASNIDQIVSVGALGCGFPFRLNEPDEVSIFTSLENMISLIPDNRHEKPGFLYHLALCNCDIFDANKTLVNLDKAIFLFERADEINDGKKSHLSRHGCAYILRYNSFSQDLHDLNKGIELLEHWACENEARLGPKEQDTTYILACAYFSRFNMQPSARGLDDLVHAWSAITEGAVIEENTTASRHHAEKYDKFVQHLSQFKDVSDIPVVLDAIRAEVTALGDGDIITTREPLESYGLYLSIRIKAVLDSTVTLDDIFLQQLATEAERIPDIYPKKALWLNMAGNFLLDTAKPGSDITRAITIFNHITNLPETGYPLYGDSSNRLGCALRQRYIWWGDLSDINEAINVFEDALHSGINIHGAKHMLLTNLSSCLSDRYHRLGDLSDFNRSCLALDAARTEMEKVNNTTALPVLDDNIGQILMTRTRLIGTLESINEAIRFYEWQITIPKPTSDQASDFASMGVSFLDKFRVGDNIQDLHRSLDFLGKAVERSKNNSAIDRANILQNHGAALCARFFHLHDVDDINMGIETLKQAEILTPDLHPLKCHKKFVLGLWLPVRFESLGDNMDLIDAFTYLSDAAKLPAGPVKQRFRSATLWAFWIKKFRRGSPIAAYSQAMELLPLLAWIGSSMSNRQIRLLDAREALVDAVAAALDLGQHQTAIEWLEMGHGILWAQIYELRSPIDDLQALKPDLANRIRHLSEQLDDNTQYSSGMDTLAATTTPRYHDMAHERAQVIEQVQRLPGFDNFLRPRTFQDLLVAAKSGPVISINISATRCDALALMPTAEISVIPLEQFSFEDAIAMAETLHKLLIRQGKVSDSLSRGRSRHILSTKRGSDPEIEMEDILSKLWTRVAKPILDGINIKEPSTSDIPRIWWCLSGPMAYLPLHAAGTYRDRDAPGSKLSDFVISSYIPSISSLINCYRPRRHHKGQIMTVGLSINAATELPQVVEELANIAGVVGAYPTLCLLNSDATVQNVISGLQSSSYVHFACHGTNDRENPSKSALLLTGQSKLLLSDIASLKLDHGELAFLSACQTAQGDAYLPDEALHIAAGMLSAGYRSVIGTMWAIEDADAPLVAKGFYENLLGAVGEEETIDISRSAYSLHKAVQSLRTNITGRKSLFSWIPFVHFGA